MANEANKEAAEKTIPQKSSAEESPTQLSGKKTSPQQTSQKSGNEEVTWLSIGEIGICDQSEFQFRNKNDQDAIDRYTETLAFNTQGEKVEDDRHWPFPKIVVYLMNGVYIVLSGIHRLLAAKQAGRKEIPVTVFKGTKEEAIWFGLGANRENGLSLNKGDLKYCIKKALKMGNKSNRAIASHLGCSEAYVRKIVGEVRTSAQPNEKRTGKDGKQHPAQKAAHKKTAPVEQEQADTDVVPENMEQQDDTKTQPVDTASQTWQGRFREKFITSTNEQEHLTPQIGLKILKYICDELEPESSDRVEFLEGCIYFIKSTPEYKARPKNNNNPTTTDQGAEHEQQ